MPQTLGECLTFAASHWRGGKQPIFARRCVQVLGEALAAESLTPIDGVNLLAALAREGLSRKTVQIYYRTFKRMLTLNGLGGLALLWPNAPTPPRQTRDAISEADIVKCCAWLREQGWSDTCALAVILTHTGMRVAVELLAEGSTVATSSVAYMGVELWIRGKGGHERLIYVDNANACKLLLNAECMAAIREVTYEVHRNRWNKAVKACGVTSRLASLHSLRHYYAGDAYRKSGKDISMVQKLLGHSSPITTAGYLHTNLDDMAEALSGRE